MKAEEYEENGIPLIRVSNCRTGEILIDEELVYISEEKHRQLIRSEVLPGDVLVTKAGHILGYSAVFPDFLQRGNITSHLAAIRPTKNINPHFLSLFLSSSIGNHQIYRWGNKATRPELNTDEVREILVPLPPLAVQRSMVEEMEQARESRRRKLTEAEALISGLDGFLLEQLGLPTSLAPSKNVFAIKAQKLDGPLNPERYRALVLEKEIKGKTLDDVAEIVENKITPSLVGVDSEWDWIRIDDLENQPLEVQIPRTALGRDIEGSFFSVREGDLLIARLGPTILNRKFILCPKTRRQTVASSEFLVLRCRNGWKPLVVLWTLRTSLYRELIYSKARGATPSRYRVNREDFAKLPFPTISVDLQDQLAAEITVRLNAVRCLREEAMQEWKAAKNHFEARLLGERNS